jgi:hypothetical protein
MLRKSLVPSALLLSISALSAMTSAAQAADMIVPFKGSVVKACEFVGEPIPGTLTGNSSVLPTQLSSANTAGKAGSVTIRCNTDATVKAAAPKMEDKNFTASYGLGAKSADAVTVPKGVETPVAVNLSINSTTPIPVGDYSYNVLVTATPN